MSFSILGQGAVTRRRRTLALVAAVPLLATPLAVLSSSAAQAAAPITLNVLGTNDFHGRINSNTVRWAWEIQHLRDTTVTPSDGSLLVGAGDNVGASEFASAVQNDQPTLDVLKEVGLNVSSVGNHEFDKGWADLKNRIIGGDPNNPTNIPWKYLGANVYAKGTTTPVLPEYDMFTEGPAGSQVKVAVIGAVTQETASLVSPGGIADLTFGNAADAINRVARQLSDGNPANGEADVIIAAVHAGAVDGTKTYTDEYANGGEFQQLANLDPSVNAVFEGHTHQTYVYNAPLTGGDTATRPLLQTGSYGSNIGQVVFSIDPTTGHVLSYTAKNNAVPTAAAPAPGHTDNASYIADYPTVLNQVNTTVNNALAYAAQVGNTAVGGVTADITTAYSGGSYATGTYAGGTRDDRGKESTLGDLVANALRDGLPADLGHADLGIVNPGGLRSELFYAGDTVNGGPNNTDGVVTYAEANSVLPFVNNIWTVQLTGAQLKQIFEEQWSQANPGEATPSRPFLNLGVSDNVRITRDPSQPRGRRITSVHINGKLIDPTKTYSVCTFSFLGTGGDYFHTFTKGVAKDTGLVDRDLWISYLKAHPGLKPSFDRQQVDAQGMPMGKVAAGQKVSFSLSNLDLTSLGSPRNPTVDVYLDTRDGARKVGTFKTTNDGTNGGAALVSFTAPADLPSPSRITAVARPTNTIVGAQPKSYTKVPHTKATYGHSRVVTVRVGQPAGGVPTGTVILRGAGKELGRATVGADGTAAITVSGTALTAGSYTVTARYQGDANDSKSSDTATFKVRRATPKLTLFKRPRTATVRKSRVKVTVLATAYHHPVQGVVTVRSGGRLYRGRIHNGVVTFRLHSYPSTGRKKLVVRYLGNNRDRSKKLVKHVVVHH